MKIVNAKGQSCPKPLIMTKKALSELRENEALKILLDNEVSKINVVSYLKDNDYYPEVEKKDKEFVIVMNKNTKTEVELPYEEYCKPSGKIGDFVVSIQKNKMGDGSDELGEILMKAFVNSLPDASFLPSVIIFINSGIQLCIEDSPVIESLKKMEENGVEILVCGTCLDYFNKLKNLEAGKVSNMYEITEKLTNASKVIYP
ncbi:MAG: sulfurtransferase-like selenium metabolism protein YedF [Bacteroidetes bacterium]|jgi:selenium metabolism protein YedF|nr:sulfurtransferase-like selenium metabolism protein YedF [Bacteroidota bacterium]MBT6685419.1 sulfurtransferase-like selenium metabolism protein YedF [Bacteroidota bacterium]MBT7144215.1 sulfurtransferase-like selenium metabolism protein YedF [Bacteroidota bacterium]MBT7492145.1 sulfurtransferase-like selenium metabolism protein YedF [Bacteroidota bacterium]